MIEPTGTPVDVFGVKNNQSSKQPNGGMPQRQTQEYGAQDDGAGFLSGVADEIPGKTQRLDDCLKQAQDSGSHAAGISVGAKVNVGAPGWSGEKALTDFGGGTRDAATADLENTSRSVQGNTYPDGTRITIDNADIGVADGMLPGFPRGIIE